MNRPRDGSFQRVEGQNDILVDSFVHHFPADFLRGGEL